MIGCRALSPCNGRPCIAVTLCRLKRWESIIGSVHVIARGDVDFMPSLEGVTRMRLEGLTTDGQRVGVTRLITPQELATLPESYGWTLDRLVRELDKHLAAQGGRLR